MGDIRLFRYGEDGSLELAPHFAQMERNLQSLVEAHMESLLGIRLLAHEYRTGRPQTGFIDSLGLDENNCPVIIEYKRHNNENIICQGLYYLDWLMTHKAEFAALARKACGEAHAGRIDFEGARLLCIASAFSRYDELAIMQIDRNIELLRYRFYEQNLLLLEMLNTSLRVFMEPAESPSGGEDSKGIGMPTSLRERVRSMSQETEQLYFEVLTFARNLGDDVSVRFLKHYLALARLKNFACIQPHKNALKLWLNLDPGSIELEEGFSRDVTAIGHHASGNLQINVSSRETFEKACPLIDLAYQSN